jgi:hypothetical protein
VARDPLPPTPSFDRFARRHRQGIWRRRGNARPSRGREQGPSRPCETPRALERRCKPGPTGQSRGHKPLCLRCSTPISGRMHARPAAEAPRLEPLKSAVRPLFDKWGPCRESGDAQAGSGGPAVARTGGAFSGPARPQPTGMSRPTAAHPGLHAGGDGPAAQVRNSAPARPLFRE